MTLKERREAAGILQETVSKKLDVSQGTVSKWESGSTRRISRKYHKKLAKLYGCTVEELFGKEGAQCQGQSH